MKAGIDELEFFAIHSMKLHVNLVLVHLAIKDQLIGGGSLESEVSGPVLAVGIGEGEDFVVDVDRRAVRGKRVVRPLKSYDAIVDNNVVNDAAVKDDTAPTVFVSLNRCAGLSVYRKGVYVPDPIELGLGSAAAT